MVTGPASAGRVAPCWSVGLQLLPETGCPAHWGVSGVADTIAGVAHARMCAALGGLVASVEELLEELAGWTCQAPRAGFAWVRSPRRWIVSFQPPPTCTSAWPST
jgi:hypothetical protein